MRLLVYLRDARTVYLIPSRGALARLARAEPWNEGGPVAAVRGIWNPHTGEYLWTRVGLRYIAKGSIASVEEARGVADAKEMLLEREGVDAA